MEGTILIGAALARWFDIQPYVSCLFFFCQLYSPCFFYSYFRSIVQSCSFHDGLFTMIVKRECRGLLCDSFLFLACFDEEGMVCLIDDESGAIHPGRIGALDDGDGSADEFIAKDRVVFHWYHPWRIILRQILLVRSRQQ